MDSGERKHLQDIYATEPKGGNEFTPQVSSEAAEERKRDMQRQTFSSFLMGGALLLVLCGIAYLVIRQMVQVEERTVAPQQVTNEYIPRYSLPSESQWVLDLNRSFADPEMDEDNVRWEEGNPRPFSAFWLKKAAFNVILAEQAYAIREYNEAAELYENALQIFPDIDGIKIPLGMTYFQKKEFDRAITLLQEIPMEDLDHDVLNNLGAACIEAKTYEKGEAYLKKSLEKEPAYAEALKNLAVLYKEQSFDEQAIVSYEKYLDQRPNDHATRHQFSLYLTKIGNWELASEQLNLLTMEITDQAQLYFLLAQVETHLEHSEEAMRALQRGVKLVDPTQAIAFMNSQQFDELRQSEEFRQLESVYK